MKMLGEMGRMGKGSPSGLNKCLANLGKSSELSKCAGHCARAFQAL